MDGRIMKFSIMVPVYNVEKYIRECIESVLNQTYDDFELILVDDGSKDDSGKICDEYASRDNRIIVIHKENGGLISARRAAIKVAQGEYCLFLDSDDYLAHTTLDVLSGKIISYNCDCVYFGYIYVDENSNFIKYSDDIKSEQFINEPKVYYKRIFCNSSFNSLCRKVVRRDLIPDIDYSQYYHISLGEDLLQTIHILHNVENVLFITECLYNYRMNFLSMTHSITYEKYNVDSTVREKVLEFINEQKVFSEDDYREYRTYCAKLLIAEIIRIGMFDTSFFNKKQLYNEIRDNSYYQSFVLTGEINRKSLGKTAWIYDCFLKKYDRIILVFLSLYSKLVSIKRWFKK